MEFYGTLRLGEKFRNFIELYNGSDGTEQLRLTICWSQNTFIGEVGREFVVISNAHKVIHSLCKKEVSACDCYESERTSV